MSLFRIFCCGRFHQFVVLMIFTNTSNDSGCHWASSLYNFEKDETHGLHSADSSPSHSSVGWAVESHGVEPSSRWRLRALRRLRSDTAARGGYRRPHRCRGAAPRRGRRRGCCEQRRPGAPETAGGDDRGWSRGMIWCRVSERTNSVTSCLVILNAPCAESCGRIKLLGGNSCRWNWYILNLLKYMYCTSEARDMNVFRVCFRLRGLRFLALSWWDVWQVSTWGDKPTQAAEHSGIHWHSVYRNHGQNLLRIFIRMILATAIRTPTIRLYIVGDM